MVIKKVKCVVCRVYIPVKAHVMGSGKGSKRTCYVDSDDGVAFGKTTWFCNDCWNEMIEAIKKDGVFDGM